MLDNNNDKIKNPWDIYLCFLKYIQHDKGQCPSFFIIFQEKDTLKTGNSSQVSFEGLSPTSDDDEKMVHFTFSPSDGKALRMQMQGKGQPEGFKV